LSNIDPLELVYKKYSSSPNPAIANTACVASPPTATAAPFEADALAALALALDALELALLMLLLTEASDEVLLEWWVLVLVSVVALKVLVSVSVVPS
jgi:hypothetical protein